MQNKYLIFLIISAFCKHSSATLEELEKLLILQKNYQIAKKAGTLPDQQAYLERLHGIDIEEIKVPSPQGHDIPTIIYKPKDQKEPAPTVIHVHGGPHVHMSTELTHAEVIYLVGQGFE